MYCKDHPDVPASGACVYCGNMFCESCLVTVKGRRYCREHVDAAFEQPSAAANPTPVQVHVSNVNTSTSGSDATAASNAYAYAGANVGVAYARKSKMVALLLCVFLGYWGIHRFYVGKIGTGVLYLFTGGLCGIGWIVDIILIACGAFYDIAGQPLA